MILNSIIPTTNAHTTNVTSDIFNELQKNKGRIYLQLNYVFIQYLIIILKISSLNCYFV